MPDKQQESKQQPTATKIADPGKDLTTRAERKAERLKVYKPPKTKADKDKEREQRIQVWGDRYGLGDISESRIG